MRHCQRGLMSVARLRRRLRQCAPALPARCPPVAAKARLACGRDLVAVARPRCRCLYSRGEDAACPRARPSGGDETALPSPLLRPHLTVRRPALAAEAWLARGRVAICCLHGRGRGCSTVVVHHAPARLRGILPSRRPRLARGVAIVARRPSPGGAIALLSPSLRHRPTARRPALSTEAQLARVRVVSHTPRGPMAVARPRRTTSRGV